MLYSAIKFEPDVDSPEAFFVQTTLEFAQLLEQRMRNNSFKIANEVVNAEIIKERLSTPLTAVFIRHGDDTWILTRIN